MTENPAGRAPECAYCAGMRCPCTCTTDCGSRPPLTGVYCPKGAGAEAYDALAVKVAGTICKHCGRPIVRCPNPSGFCQGWIHEGRPDRPVGAHYCGSINPVAEPR